MSKTPSYRAFCASDPELQAIDKKLQNLQPETGSESSKVSTLRQRLSNAATGARDLAAAILSGGPRPAVASVTAIREELEQSEVSLAALELATAALEKQREARLVVVRDAFVRECADVQLERIRKIIDALLAIAETNAEIDRFAAEQAAEGCPEHHFRGIRFPLKSGPFGGWTTEAAHIAGVIGRYVEIAGYVPPAEQVRRLMALGGEV